MELHSQRKLAILPLFVGKKEGDQLTQFNWKRLSFPDAVHAATKKNIKETMNNLAAIQVRFWRYVAVPRH